MEISPKEDVIRFVQNLPDDVSYEEIQRKIAFLKTVRESQGMKQQDNKPKI